MEGEGDRKSYTLYEKRKAVEKTNEVDIREASRHLYIAGKISNCRPNKVKNSERLLLLEESVFVPEEE